MPIDFTHIEGWTKKDKKDLDDIIEILSKELNINSS